MFIVFWILSQQKKEMFILISKLHFLMSFRPDSGCLGVKTKHLPREVLRKSTFAAIGFLIIPGFIFPDLELPWDQFS